MGHVKKEFTLIVIDLRCPRRTFLKRCGIWCLRSFFVNVRYSDTTRVRLHLFISRAFCDIGDLVQPLVSLRTSKTIPRKRLFWNYHDNWTFIMIIDKKLTSSFFVNYHDNWTNCHHNLKKAFFGIFLLVRNDTIGWTRSPMPQNAL